MSATLAGNCSIDQSLKCRSLAARVAFKYQIYCSSTKKSEAMDLFSCGYFYSMDCHQVLTL